MVDGEINGNAESGILDEANEYNSLRELGPGPMVSICPVVDFSAAYVVTARLIHDMFSSFRVTSCHFSKDIRTTLDASSGFGPSRLAAGKAPRH
jgi:hypothetical protein